MHKFSHFSAAAASKITVDHPKIRLTTSPHPQKSEFIFIDSLDTCSETEGETASQAATPAPYSHCSEPLDLNKYARHLEAQLTISDKPTNLSAADHLNDLYKRTIKSANPKEPLVRDQRYTVTNESLRRLRPGIWLNDELINAYSCLVNSRLSAAQASSRKTLCLNTFFMSKLE